MRRRKAAWKKPTARHILKCAPPEEFYDEEDELEDSAEEEAGYSELEEDLEDLPSHRNVVIRDNKMFLYGEITDAAALSFNVKLKELESRITKQLSKYNIEPKTAIIELHIHSGGGDSSAAFSMCNTMHLCGIPIDTYVDGECASAATLLFLSGRKKYVHEHSLILIHQLSTWFGFGTYHQMKDEMQNCDMLMDKIKDFYAKNTKVPAENLSAVMDHDIWWDAEKCLELGMADAVI